MWNQLFQSELLLKLRLHVKFVVSALIFKIVLFTIFSWQNFGIFSAEVSLKMSHLKVHSNFVNWRSCKNCFKNEWTLTEKFGVRDIFWFELNISSDFSLQSQKLLNQPTLGYKVHTYTIQPANKRVALTFWGAPLRAVSNRFLFRTHITKWDWIWQLWFRSFMSFFITPRRQDLLKNRLKIWHLIF